MDKVNIITNGQLECLAKRIARYVVEYMPEKDSVKFLTKKQVANYLGKSVDAIEKMCDRGQIPFHKKGRRTYFNLNELNDYFLNE